MPSGPDPTVRTKDQRRRLLPAALAVVALGLFATSAAVALSTPKWPSQTERFLPPPARTTPVVTAREHVDAATKFAVAHARKSTPKPKPTPRNWPKPRPKQMARPVRIVIPAIGVDAPIIHLGLNRDHSLQVPTRVRETGWFGPGPEPGEPGGAVIAGHVDSRSGPGVFYRLRGLRKGDRITVTLADGARVAFVVTGTMLVSKNHFPTRLVYRKGGPPRLRLITCGGAFDDSSGHYVGNAIVFAWFAGWRRGGDR